MQFNWLDRSWKSWKDHEIRVRSWKFMICHEKVMESHGKVMKIRGKSMKFMNFSGVCGWTPFVLISDNRPSCLRHADVRPDLWLSRVRPSDILARPARDHVSVSTRLSRDSAGRAGERIRNGKRLCYVTDEIIGSVSSSFDPLLLGSQGGGVGPLVSGPVRHFSTPVRRSLGRPTDV